MPKGVGLLAGILLVLVTGIGGWLWYEFSGRSSMQRSDAVAVGSGAGSDGPEAPSSGGPPAPTSSAGFPGGVVPEDDFEDGELIVVDPPDGFADSVRRMGFTVVEAADLSSLSIQLLRLKVPPGRSVGWARTDLAAAFPGLVVDANHRFHVQASGSFENNVARAAIGWQLPDPACGKGVRLGMIDTSVDVRHPALDGQDVEFMSFHAEGRREGPADHGTAVAAILVGKPTWGGLLPGATLKAANMFEQNETGRVVGNAIALLKAVNWLASERVHVINMSVAGADNSAVRVALEKAERKRLVIIAAAGNWGREDKPAYPAAYGEVIAVTAVGEDRGIYESANRGKYIDFAAPGVRIYTAVPSGGRLQSGTSFAAPYISTLMAVAIANGQKKNADSLRKVLQQGIEDLGSPGKDTTFGWGFIGQQPGC